MSFDANALLLSLLASSIGFVFFSYGKKQGRVPQMVAGVLLMVYPYFVPNWLAMTLVGAAIVGLLWVGLRLGL